MPSRSNLGRPWDAFLTEQDRLHAAMRPNPPIGFGRKPALLLIDLYNWVFGDKPEPLLTATKRWPGSCGLAAWNALPRIQTLLDAARMARIPIVYSTEMDERNLPVRPWSKRGRAAATPLRDWRAQRTGEKDTRYEIIDPIKPLPDELVIQKTAPSVFCGTSLLAHLNSLRVDTVITSGESTSGCVRATVVDGCAYHFRMIVVEDCVFDRAEASHAISLFDMDQKYADVVSLGMVVRFLRKKTTRARS